MANEAMSTINFDSENKLMHVGDNIYYGLLIVM